jgi:hypothetical protein
VLQGVQLAFGKRRDPAGYRARFADFPGRVLRQYGHDG